MRLPVVSKLLGKIDLSQMLIHLKCTNLWHVFHLANQSQHSAETALLRVFNYLLTSSDSVILLFSNLYKALVRPPLECDNVIWSPYLKRKSVTIKRVQRRATRLISSWRDLSYRERLAAWGDSDHISVLTLHDLRAVFDTIDHDLLLNYLRDFLVFVTLLLHSLVHMTGSVLGCESEPSSLLYGVPQGSVLGSILFMLYTQPLSDIIERHSSSCTHSLYLISLNVTLHPVHTASI